jgi:hypothetical protein
MAGLVTVALVGTVAQMPRTTIRRFVVVSRSLSRVVHSEFMGTTDFLVRRCTRETMNSGFRFTQRCPKFQIR